jgi:ankyrin repeat protein
MAEGPNLWTLLDHPNTNALEEALINGADPNIYGPYHETPLMRAVKTDNIDAVTILLRYRANFNARDSNGRTALLLSCDNFEIMQILLSSGSNVDDADCVGMTALAYCVMNHCIKQVSLLLHYKANPNQKIHRKSLFGSVIQTMNFDVIKIFMEHKADPNCNVGDCSALRFAIMADHIDLIKLLIASGVELGSEEKDLAAEPKYRPLLRQIKYGQLYGVAHDHVIERTTTKLSLQAMCIQKLSEISSHDEELGLSSIKDGQEEQVRTLFKLHFQAS